VAVRQLRTALSEQGELAFAPIPVIDGHYRINPAFTLDLDVQAMRRAMHTNDARAMQRALTSYPGPFLPSVESEWACLEREEVQQNAIALALNLGDLLEPSSPSEAIEAYLRACELEPTLSQAWLAIMRLQLGQGRVLSARQTLFQARTALAEFGLEPEPPFLLAAHNLLEPSA
jgi:DNA-binding SARP family transcriptional activator